MPVRLSLLPRASSDTFVQSFPRLPKPEGIEMRPPIPKKETGCTHTSATAPGPSFPKPQPARFPPPAWGRCCRAEPPRPGPWQQATPIVCLRLQPGGKEQGRHCSQIPASKERRIKGGGEKQSWRGERNKGPPSDRGSRGLRQQSLPGKAGKRPRPHPREAFPLSEVSHCWRL